MQKEVANTKSRFRLTRAENQSMRRLRAGRGRKKWQALRAGSD